MKPDEFGDKNHMPYAKAGIGVGLPFNSNHAIAYALMNIEVNDSPKKWTNSWQIGMRYKPTELPFALQLENEIMQRSHAQYINLTNLDILFPIHKNNTINISYQHRLGSNITQKNTFGMSYNLYW